MGLRALLIPFRLDCSTSRASVLDVDGRLDPRVARHIQEDVDIEAGVRRGRSARRSPENILGIYRNYNFKGINQFFTIFADANLMLSELRYSANCSSKNRRQNHFAAPN